MRLQQFEIVRGQRVPGRVSVFGGIGDNVAHSLAVWIAFDVLQTFLGRGLQDHDDAFRVVKGNLDLIEQITIGKYERGDYVPHPQASPGVDLVIINREDIEGTGGRLRDPRRITVPSWQDGRFGPAAMTRRPAVG